MLANFVTIAGTSAREAEGVAAALASGGNTAVLNGVAASLRQMSKRATELMATSMLAKITGAAEDGALENAAFVRRLDEHARDLKQTAEMALSKMQRIETQVGTARTLLTEMAQASHDVLATFRKDHVRLAELEAAHETHVATTHDNTAKLVRDTAAAVGCLIGCLQYPDTFAQRIAHVSTMLDDARRSRRPAVGG